jgi:RNA polymerase sigma-70 factor (ECF subfamily)
VTAPVEPWVDVFESARPRLLGLAYRMLGTISDAEDVVQEAFLKWHVADHPTIEKPDAWLTTVTSRVALDRLRASKRRREEYVGPWLPEPVVTDPGPGPEDTAVRTESLTLGFLAVLDRLAPVERAVFLLADVFGVPFAEIAESVGKSPAACRQIAVRARTRVRGEAPTFVAHPDRGVVEKLLMAVALGDMDGVLSVLAPDATCVSDGGASTRAARRPVVGAHRVSRFLVNLTHKYGPDVRFASATINGDPGLIVSFGEVVDLVASFEVRDGRVSTIWVVRNPDKLLHLADRIPIS